MSVFATVGYGAEGTITITDATMYVQNGVPFSIGKNGFAGTHTATNCGLVDLSYVGTINIRAVSDTPSENPGGLIAGTINVFEGSQIVINHDYYTNLSMLAPIVSQSEGAGDILFEDGHAILDEDNSKFSGPITVKENAQLTIDSTESTGEADLVFFGEEVVVSDDATIDDIAIGGDIFIQKHGYAVFNTLSGVSGRKLILSGTINNQGSLRALVGGTLVLS
ncbi:hypothetical protein [Pseudovibrio sp. Tun.PSC04-5.I4]|uniref:hypothetical protein n=1 Tax=Pseudovibrio sp. Tun.PSC04-5.I4 TaxID=1798213 RepID=UPI00117A2A9F|nr:hypothetical protein [Pseudovibrio sp. Tun.PSC04-5.I4]